MIRSAVMGPMSTGTSDRWVEFEPQVIDAQRILAVMPVVLVNTETQGESITVAFEMRIGGTQIDFISNPIGPRDQPYDRQTRVFALQKLIELDHKADGEVTIELRMRNIKSCTVSPYAGVHILYEHK